MTDYQLERRIHALERRNKELVAQQAGQTLEEYERDEFARIDNAIAKREEAKAEESKRAREQQHREAVESWLRICGVPLDAADELKTLCFAIRGFDEASFNVFADVALAIAGKKRGDGSGWSQTVALWPKLAPAMQAVLTRLASRMAGLHQQMDQYSALVR